MIRAESSLRQSQLEQVGRRASQLAVVHLDRMKRERNMWKSLCTGIVFASAATLLGLGSASAGDYYNGGYYGHGHYGHNGHYGHYAYSSCCYERIVKYRRVYAEPYNHHSHHASYYYGSYYPKYSSYYDPYYGGDYHGYGHNGHGYGYNGYGTHYAHAYYPHDVYAPRQYYYGY
jgi:hypothetical protein